MLRRALAPMWLALILVPAPFSSAAIHAQQAEYQRERQRFDHIASADPAIADGIAWYLQSRVVAAEFERTHRRRGYRFWTTCFFDCTVSWPFGSLIVSRWSDGVGRPEALRAQRPREWPVLDRRLPPGLDVRALRMAMLFASLERELGWPTLQGALDVVAAARDGRPVIDLLESATARSLGTAFAIALQHSGSDFAVGDVAIHEAPCASPPCIETRVSLTREGDMPFPLEVRIEFADRSTFSTYWDGTATELAVQSAALPARARIDPERVWLLDDDYANGEYVRSRGTNVAVVKWLAQWITWLQQAMLTYSFAA
jgi:hypothetical protein